jgi:hypothetical protein
MNKVTLAVLLGLLSTSALAAPKPCEELRAEIEVKIQAAGVASYTLEIVPNEDTQDPQHGGRQLRRRHQENHLSEKWLSVGWVSRAAT